MCLAAGQLAAMQLDSHVARACIFFFCWGRQVMVVAASSVQARRHTMTHNIRGSCLREGACEGDQAEEQLAPCSRWAHYRSSWPQHSAQRKQ